MVDLGKTLRQAASDSGWSMKRIADEGGLHYASVHGFLVSNRTLTLETASKLCELFGLELRPVRRSKKKGGR